MEILFDKNNTIKAELNKTTGFLTAPVNLARTGVQYYLGYELGLNERGKEKIGVFRSPTEVFKQSSIDSFINLVITTIIESRSQ